MLTLGIDIASADKPNGIVTLRWDPLPRVELVDVGRFDTHDIAAHIDKARAEDPSAWIAIDAPFGFPTGFAAAVAELHTSGRISELDPYVWRRTEQVVHDRLAAEAGVNRSALSSVTSLITGTTVRAIELVSRYQDGAIDKIGLRSGIVETYPAGCLYLWGLMDAATDGDGVAAEHQPNRYKATGASAAALAGSCAALLERILDLAPSLADADPAHLSRLRSSGDAIDALICALVAGAVAATAGTPHSTGPGDADTALAAAEGWIHLPGLSQLTKAAA